MQNFASTKLPTKYCIIELNSTKAIVTDPMSMAEVDQFIKKKYGEQPLNYFNDTHSLWLIDIANRSIRPLSIRIEI